YIDWRMTAKILPSVVNYCHESLQFQDTQRRYTIAGHWDLRFYKLQQEEPGAQNISFSAGRVKGRPLRKTNAWHCRSVAQRTTWDMRQIVISINWLSP
ncbi:hypothetical protein BaRGS_00032196, partial [Batillaria attramentaria]